MLNKIAKEYVMEYGTYEAHGGTFDKYGNPIKEVNILDIEEYIHVAWNIKDDIGLIIDFISSDNTDDDYEERLLIMLKGIKEMYQLRFENLYNVYERYVQQEFIKNKKKMEK